MTKSVLLTTLLLSAAWPLTEAAPRRIAVEPEPTVIYAVGALSGCSGVYKLSTSAYEPIQISDRVAYYFNNGGGTFTSETEVYGTADLWSSYYLGKATAQGNGDGAWSHTYWNYRNASNVNYTVDRLAYDMACSPVDGTVFGWFCSSNGFTRLGKFNTDDYSVTQVGTASMSTVINALAFDGEGTLWGVAGETGTLYKINTSTAELTPVSSLGVTASAKAQSAAIDAATGKMYWGAVESGMTAALYEIDLSATAPTAKYCYSFPMGKRFNAFYIAPPAAPDGVPAQAENLSATFKGTATTISFNAPTTNKGGETLDETDMMSYTLTVDNNKLDDGVIPPGELYSKDFALAEGDHVIAVELQNAVGLGQKSILNTWIGFDTPLAVGNLKATVDGNNVKLSWDAPEGEKGGTVDFSKISYTVTRLPEGKVVKENLKECAFTDAIPDGTVRSYSWVVTVKSGDTKGAEASTPSMLIGSPYTVPYSETFDNANSFDDVCFSSVDLDQGTPSWEFVANGDNKYASITGIDGKLHRDYLFGAPVSLNAGVEYTLRFKIACSQAGETTQLRIFLAKAHDKDALVTPYIKPNFGFMASSGNEGVFQQQEMTFTVEEDGTYSVGFYDFAAQYSTNTVMIDDIEITAPVTPTPGVNNLSITKVYAPETIACGSFGNVQVIVVNKGKETVSDYTVSLWLDDELVVERNGAKLDAGSMFVGSLPVQWQDVPELTYTVKLTYDNDSDLSDNQATVTVKFGEKVAIENVETTTSLLGAEVYTITGLKVAVITDNTDAWRASLPTGIYIVRTAEKTFKIKL